MLHAVTGCYTPLQGVTWCYTLLHCLTLCNKLLHGVTGWYMLLHGVTMCYMLLHDVTRCYRLLPCITRCYKLLHDVCVLSSVLLQLWYVHTSCKPPSGCSYRHICSKTPNGWTFWSLQRGESLVQIQHNVQELHSLQVLRQWLLLCIQ